jgi:peptidoglycan/LPS O-acetylase OafA/YrhL
MPGMTSSPVELLVPKTPVAGTIRIPELDGLRGIAILIVILFHYVVTGAEPSNRLGAAFYDIFRIGWAGVDLFFILSGFLIGGILLDAKESGSYFKTFYVRRVYRIFPIYYLWITAYFLLVAVSSAQLAQQLGIIPAGWTCIPVYAFYLQNTWKLNATLRSPWLAHLWSLAVEEQFYLVIPWLIRFLSRGKLLLLLLGTMVLAPMTRIALVLYFPTHEMAPYRMTICRADALAAGVLLAIVWRDPSWIQWILDHLKSLNTVVGLLFLGVICLGAFHPTQYGALSVLGYSWIDLFFACLLLRTLLRPEGIWAAFCRRTFLIDLGGVSYCAYIIHLAVNVLCHAELAGSSRGVSTWPAFAATIVAAGMTWSIAKISWRLFEYPILRRAHAFQYSPMTHSRPGSNGLTAPYTLAARSADTSQFPDA